MCQAHSEWPAFAITHVATVNKERRRGFLSDTRHQDTRVEGSSLPKYLLVQKAVTGGAGQRLGAFARRLGGSFIGDGFPEDRVKDSNSPAKQR